MWSGRLGAGGRFSQRDHEGRDGERLALVQAEALRVSFPEIEEKRLSTLEAKSAPSIGEPKASLAEPEYPVVYSFFVEHYVAALTGAVKG